MSREKTLSDMKDSLERMKALESHAKMFCGDWTKRSVYNAVISLERAILGLEAELEEIERLAEEE